MTVDIKTILLAQRVNSHWQGTITNSTRLQKQLFFTAANPEDLYLLQLANPDPDGYTLIVRQSAFEQATKDKLGIAGIDLTDYAQSNPFFRRVATSSEGDSWFTEPEIERPTFELPVSSLNTIGVRPSWMRMFVTQPPNVLCWPNNYTHFPPVEQKPSGAFEANEALCSRVAMFGFAMRGKYYWDAVERSLGASEKAKVVDTPSDKMRRVAVTDESDD